MRPAARCWLEPATPSYSHSGGSQVSPAGTEVPPPSSSTLGTQGTLPRAGWGGGPRPARRGAAHPGPFERVPPPALEGARALRCGLGFGRTRPSGPVPAQLAGVGPGDPRCPAVVRKKSSEVTKYESWIWPSPPPGVPRWCHRGRPWLPFPGLDRPCPSQ